MKVKRQNNKNRKEYKIWRNDTMNNIPVVKLGLIAVSRDCFPIQLSEKRRAAIKAAYQGELYECPVTVENEKDMEKALEDVNKAECNALVVFPLLKDSMVLPTVIKDGIIAAVSK